MQYSAFGATNTGKVRNYNEDAFYVAENNGFFIVADGMGGLEAGEIASKITRDTIAQILNEQLEKADSVETLIKEAFIKANVEVRKALAETSVKKGMGCTCVVLVFKDNDFFVGYVGDSRIYLLRSKKLKQLSRDHSYVEELFTRGLISEEEKKDHPYKNSITRFIGHADKIDVDISAGPISNKDTFLLCSDGLTGEVEDAEIEKILSTSESIENKVKKLIATALENGGGDNVTVVVVTVNRKKPGFLKKLFGW